MRTRRVAIFVGAAFVALVCLALAQLDAASLSPHERRREGKAATSTPSPLVAHALVRLSGEFGNHLSVFAAYKFIHIIARRDHNLDLKHHLAGQGYPKSAITARNCKECLVRMRNMNFTECDDNYDNLAKEQVRILGDAGLDSEKLIVRKRKTEHVHEVRERLAYYVGILRNESIVPFTGTKNTSYFALPFLEIGLPSHSVLAEMVDREKREIREYLNFSDKCCKALPEPDETVFHYRMFLVEMPRRGIPLGFAEMGPNQTAMELRRHLKPGSKVAILSRFKDGTVNEYKDLLARNLSVRIVVGQSGLEDFCFMMHAKTLFASYKSSFATWAAYLSPSMTNATLYIMDYEFDDRPKDGVYPLARYRWHDESLKRTLHFPVFNLSVYNLLVDTMKEIGNRTKRAGTGRRHLLLS